MQKFLRFPWLLRVQPQAPLKLGTAAAETPSDSPIANFKRLRTALWPGSSPALAVEIVSFAVVQPKL
jgi:hypothetical protein